MGSQIFLAEISAACTAENMDMGLYLSPWDIHDPSYGYKDENGKPVDPNSGKDKLDYNEYYNNQLQEILGNKKYGNNGHFVEVWMDGAKGSGANAQEYDFQRWFKTIQANEGIEAGLMPIVCCLEQKHIQRFVGSEMSWESPEKIHGQSLK